MSTTPRPGPTADTFAKVAALTGLDPDHLARTGSIEHDDAGAWVTFHKVGRIAHVRGPRITVRLRWPEGPWAETAAEFTDRITRQEAQP